MVVDFEQRLGGKQNSDTSFTWGAVGWCKLPRQIFFNMRVNSEKPNLLAKPPIFGADYSADLSRINNAG